MSHLTKVRTILISRPQATSATGASLTLNKNVWCGVHNNQGMNTYTFHQNLRTYFYESHMLHDLVGDFTSSIPVSFLSELWFQHDGAPPHTSILVAAFLERNFSSHWIGPKEQFLGQRGLRARIQ